MRKQANYEIDAGEVGLYCYSTEEIAVRRFEELTREHPNLSIRLTEFTPQILKLQQPTRTFECTRCAGKCRLIAEQAKSESSLPKYCPYNSQTVDWKEVENEK